MPSPNELLRVPRCRTPPAANLSPSCPFSQRRCLAASGPGDAEALTSMPRTAPPAG